MAAAILVMVWSRSGSILPVADGNPDKLPQSPCLTLPPEAASLIDSHDGAEKPAALFQDDNMEDSVITLKGTEGGKADLLL